MDIANLGFAVDTGDLDKAVTKLNSLGPAAAGVQSAANKMASAVEGANASVSSSASSVAKVEALAADAIFRRMKLSETATKEQVAAANAARLKAQETLKAVVAEEKYATALMATAAAQKRVGFGSVSSVMMGRGPATGPSLAVNNGASVPRDSRPNKFNTANIAAQFQDIGVTAAMGMNPLQIALQQGTQLAAIMNSMEKPVAGLAEAFKQVFNAVSLGTIAIIAIVAGLIELVNWSKVAKAALYGFANVLVTITPYVMGLVTIMALFYSEAIISGIGALTVGFVRLGGAALVAGYNMLAAWVMALSPLQLMILGIVAVAAVFAAFGVNVTAIMKTVVNAIVGGFVGAFNAIKATWKLLPGAIGDLTIQAVNLYLKYIQTMINGTVEMLNKIIRATGGTEIKFKADLQIDNAFAGQAAAVGKIAGNEITKAMNVDYAGKAINAAKSAAASAARSIRSYADTIGQKKPGKGKTPEDLYDEVLRGADRKLAVMKAEQDSIGMSEFATAKLKYETELLNDAQQKNIVLTQAGHDELMGRANDMALMETKTKNLKEAFDFAKDATKGFFEDMKTGIQQGKGLWESFGNAVMNVLNKILDKMLNSGVDMLFGGSGGGVGGGGLGVFGSLFGGLIGHGTNAPAAGAMGPTQPGTGIMGMLGFAKGGAFTNTIVNKSTPFQFAAGGALGEMGEAGPEAIVPLHRGPDGSLGVKMAGGGGNTQVNVNIINNNNSSVSTEQRQTSNGMEIDVMIDKMVAQKVSDQSSETNRSLQTRDQRRLISR